MFPVMMLTATFFCKDESRSILLKSAQICVLMHSAVYVYQWMDFLANKELEFVFDYRLHLASTLGNKNFYAEVLMLLLPVCVISFFSLTKFWKWFSLLNCFVIVVSILLTRSFAVLAASLVSAFVVFAVYYSNWSGRKRSGLKLAAIAAGIIVFAGLVVFKSGAFKDFNQRFETIQQYIQNPELMDSTTKANSNSTFERILLWRNSIELIKENPLSGCGANNWKLFYPKFGIGGTRFIEAGYVHYEHPHNDYLLVASEAGIPALVAYLLFFLSLAWVAMKRIRSRDKEYLLIGGILFALIGFMLLSIFSFPRIRFYGWMIMGVYAGLLFALDQKEGERRLIFSAEKWKILLMVCIGISVWSLYAGIIRFSGEGHSKIMQVAKKQRNMARVVRESEKATSWFFPIDETATPFTWYKGMAMFYSGNVSGARIEFEDALKKNPYHIQLLNDLATTYEQTNEREKAISFYQRALAITPYFPQSLLNISACYFNIGRKDSAYIFIDKLYGIKLAFHEKTSYDIYLPAILREKIYMEANMIPDDSREKAMSEATDSAFVNEAYRLSKGKRTHFLTELTSSLLEGKSR
jgi:O-antigen ligase